MNKLSLNGTSKRMKKAVNLYSDALQTKRRKCPLIMRDGCQMGCLLKDCMWWAEDECALAKISRRMELEEIPEATIQ